MPDDARYREGLRVRREVLGDAHVDASLEARTDFSAPFQELITRYAWGSVWTREGLSRRDRSLITLAMLVAVNREAELRMHARAALRNGVTREEIREVLLQTAIYCGVPAANAAFHAVEPVLAAEVEEEVEGESGKGGFDASASGTDTSAGTDRGPDGRIE